MLRCTTYVYTAMPYLVPPVTPRDAFFPTPLVAAQKESSKVKGSFFVLRAFQPTDALSLKTLVKNTRFFIAFI